MAVPKENPVVEHHSPPPTADIELTASRRLDSIDEPTDKAINSSRIDNEVAAYAGTTRVEIDDHTNKRLKRLVDRRVLSVMIITYFLQALDKGTISFVAIMGFNEDTGLVGQQV